MEKQFKIFGFVIILAVLGVGIFGYVQTKDLKKKLVASETLITEKSNNIDSLAGIINKQNDRIDAINRVLRNMQEAENRRQEQAALAAQAAQAKAEEEASKKEKEKEAAKLKADAAEKDKKAGLANTKPGAGKTATPAAKTSAKKPVAKKPLPPKKKVK